MWTELATQNAIDYLMDSFGGFHDSCLTTLSYKSGAYVAQDLSMNPVNHDRQLCITFQRQARNPMTIELEFSGLQRLNLLPFDENYTCEILDASLLLDDNNIVFTDAEIANEDMASSFLIRAKKVRWRMVA